MGSACLYQLAKRGASVLGLEQFDIPHALGSSGGISRQTKVAPYLGSRYEALILRANENWRTLEKDSKQNIFQQCGYLKLEINQKSVGTEWTNIEIVDGADLHHRFPQFQNLPDGTSGLLDHQGLAHIEPPMTDTCNYAVRPIYVCWNGIVPNVF